MDRKKKSETKAEQLEELKKILRNWQKIEDGSVEHTTAILEKTQNPLLRLVMEIIRQDSVMHKKVQQAILDSLEKESFTLQPEELAEIWDMIEEHDAAEEEAVRMAKAVSPHVGGFKIGLGLLHGPGPATIAALAELDRPVFADAKLHDIPSQVEMAAERLGHWGARWVTAHLSGGPTMVEAAAAGLARGSAASTMPRSPRSASR